MSSYYGIKNVIERLQLMTICGIITRSVGRTLLGVFYAAKVEFALIGFFCPSKNIQGDSNWLYSSADALFDMIDQEVNVSAFILNVMKEVD